MNDTVGLTRADAAFQVEPAAQIEHYRSLAMREGRDFDESQIPAPPSFSPQSENEVLLLHYVRPPDNEQGIVPFNFEMSWHSIGVAREEPDHIQLGTVVDLAGDPEPGFVWVGFDPTGHVIGEERDFRADSFVGREVYKGSLGGFAPSHVSRRVDPGTLAGLELLSALAVMPAVIYNAWVTDRTVPMYPIVPRLEALGRYDYLGVVEMEWWPNSEIGLQLLSWTHNHYGHEWVIPTIRAL